MTNDHTNGPVDEGFSEAWLTLREPADHAARSLSMPGQIRQWRESMDSINILDLGAGTGSNFRYLAPHLGHRQQWTLVDNDSRLLGTVQNVLEKWASQKQISFTSSNEQICIESASFSANVNCQLNNIDHQMSALEFHSADLVTASALLDLTSAAWLDELAIQCLKYNCAALFALNYNGHIRWAPEFSSDEIVTDRLNQHQLQDKGFGPALGPKAVAYLARCLENGNRRLLTVDSNWNLTVNQSELQQVLINDWASATLTLGLKDQSIITQWQQARMSSIKQRKSALTVGHSDILFL
jgi:hypothetical protein